MNKRDRNRSLADSRRDTLDIAAAHVANSKDPGRLVSRAQRASDRLPQTAPDVFV